MGRSKPASGKNSAGRIGLTVAQASNLKQVLNRGQQLNLEQLLSVLHADQHCDSNCRGKKDSPNCLCGLIPAPGSFRRKGLWQKEPQGLQHIGADPADSRKQDTATPSGLYNLGNTCYVNSALQCLFMIPAFRTSMYEVAAPVADDVIINHIRQLFADLQHGSRFSADPRALAQALNLDHTIQQDGQEFLKLLLSLLEGKLGVSGQAAVTSLVPDLFRGSYVYRTVCQACSQPSEGSSRATHFYELDIQVRGMSSLQDSLAGMLSPEDLCGDNQYFCEYCNKKADATRQLCLQQLPPYLCLSLQRFIFDMKKLMKVKASDKFTFPLSIDFGPYHSSGSGSAAAQQVYDLHAILIHKGPSASQGHYVAHVYEESSEKWWRFDDETVTAMPDGPVGEKADHGVAAAPSTSTKKAGDALKAKAKGKGRKRKKSGAGEADFAEDESTPEPMLSAEDVTLANGKAAPHVSSASTPPTSQLASDIVSSNAYMLLYKRRGWTASSQSSHASTVDVPASLEEYVRTQRKAYEEACTTFQATQQNVREAVQEQQTAVRAILDLAAVHDPGSDCRFVSADWLSRWADSDPELSQLDNSSLQCPHGKLKPSKPSDMKCISVEAWHELQQRCGGGPELGPTDICSVCLVELLDRVTSADEQGHAREAALAMAEGLEDQEMPPGSPLEAFFVSKTWLAGWKKRQGRGQNAASPTEGISCPHGQLLPTSLGPKAKRTAVPTPLWEHFQDRWQAAQQQQEEQQPTAGPAETAQNGVVVLDNAQDAELSTNGAPSSTGTSSDAEQDKQGAAAVLQVFPVHSSQECRQCLDALDASTLNGQVMASMAEQERLLAPHLAAGTPIYLEVGTRYTLMPKPWLQAWRNYVSASSRKGRAPGAALPDPPPSLREACEGLLCSCHRDSDARLAHPLPDLAHRRGKWMQTSPNDSVFEIVSTADWSQLLSRYSRDAGIRHMDVWLNVLDVVMEGASVRVEGAKADEQVFGDNLLVPLQQANAATAPQAATLESMPPVCQDTVEHQEAAVLAARLDYSDAEVMVEMVAAADFKPNMLNLTGDRKSKRARKGRAPVKVSALETIHDLKLKVVQTLSIHPQNAALHVFRAGAWQLVDDNTATLAETSILPDEEIVVVNTHEHDDDDLGSFFGITSAVRLQPERGFHGTALSDHAAVLHVQQPKAVS